jgi:hypothetical protein
LRNLTDIIFELFFCIPDIISASISYSVNSWWTDFQKISSALIFKVSDFSKYEFLIFCYHSFDRFYVKVMLLQYYSSSLHMENNISGKEFSKCSSFLRLAAFSNILVSYSIINAILIAKFNEVNPGILANIHEKIFK